VAAGAGVPDQAHRADAAWRRVALGSALAASVALVAILVMRGQAPSQAGLVAAVTQTALEPVVLSSGTDLKSQEAPAPGYTTPLDARPVSGVRSQTPLVNYVVAHSEYTTPVVRLSPLSAVISGNFDPTENTVEMTEAEVGARR
jgi:hypothetical protein